MDKMEDYGRYLVRERQRGRSGLISQETMHLCGVVDIVLEVPDTEDKERDNDD